MLAWDLTYPSDYDPSEATSFKVERADSGSDTFTDISSGASVGITCPGSCSATNQVAYVVDTSVSPGGSYVYRVSAIVDGSQGSTSTTSGITVPIPFSAGDPYDFKVMNIDNANVQATWVQSFTGAQSDSIDWTLERRTHVNIP